MKNARQVIDTLRKNGFDAYLVGGCVRDTLLNLKPKDWDITTSAQPEQICKLFEKTIKTGLRFGTVTVVIDNENIEVTTYRIESNYSDNRRPDEVKFSSSLIEDLSRRDFTMNAIAYDVLNDKFIDPFNGQSDIKNKVLKAVRDPNERFTEDSLRILRGIRFASRLGFSIDPQVYSAMTAHCDKIANISIERINIELSKILTSNNPDIGMKLLNDIGILSKFLSPITFNEKIPKNKDLETILASLLYDKDNYIDFLVKLKYTNKQIRNISFMINLINDLLENKVDDESSYIKFMSKIVNYQFMNKDEIISKLLSIDLVKERFDYENLKLIEVIPRKELQINGDDILNIINTNATKCKPNEIKNILDFCYQHILYNSEDNRKNILINLVTHYLLASDL